MIIMMMKMKMLMMMVIIIIMIITFVRGSWATPSCGNFLSS